MSTYKGSKRVIFVCENCLLGCLIQTMITELKPLKEKGTLETKYDTSMVTVCNNYM